MSHDDPLCPECGAETAWQKQDLVRFGSARLTERMQTCTGHCGWHGLAALFPWSDTRLARELEYEGSTIEAAGAR